ncbi:MAG: hypothetical protein OSB62_07750 [Alphaproteobacteria bacterium]|nr:hypothetical protein [Alphaproteobacteria bacterium]
MKKLLISILDFLIPNREVESLPWGKGFSTPIGTVTTRSASKKVKTHEQFHTLQWWMCMLLGYLMGGLFWCVTLWPALYAGDIFQGTLRTKMQHPKWQLTKCLYVGYKKSFFEWSCRWFAEQAQHDDWGAMYDFRYGR